MKLEVILLITMGNTPFSLAECLFSTKKDLRAGLTLGIGGTVVPEPNSFPKAVQEAFYLKTASFFYN